MTAAFARAEKSPHPGRLAPSDPPPPGEGEKSSRILAVAVLVLLAATAGTILIAADLAPACRIVRIAMLGGNAILGRHQRDIGVGHLVLAGIGVDLVPLHHRCRRRRLLLVRYDLDPHELRGDGFAQV